MLCLENWARYTRNRKSPIPFFWGGLRFHAGSPFQFISVTEPTTGIQLNLAKLVPGPRDGAAMMSLLTKYLRPEIRSVALLIDEVSQDSKNVKPLELSRDFAKAVSRFEFPSEGRSFNIVTILFVFPRDTGRISTDVGPISIRRFDELADFSSTEIGDLISVGLRRICDDQSGYGGRTVTADLMPLADSVLRWTGGIPRLTTALLYDSFKAFLDEGGLSGTVTVFDASHVAKALSDPRTCELTLVKTKDLVSKFAVPDDVRLVAPERILLDALAGERLGQGPWAETELRALMRGQLGRGPFVDPAIEHLLTSLKNAFLFRVDKRGRLEPRGRLVLTHLNTTQA